MSDPTCPKCGRDAACPDHAATNGAAKPAWVKPPPPHELAGVAFEPVPPDVAEHFRRTFDEAEYLAAVRDIEAGGGFRLEDFVGEIDRICHGEQ